MYNRWTIAILSAVGMSGCGPSPASVSGSGAPDRAAVGVVADTAAADPHDPCRLLRPAEVEAVLGPLAGAPFRASAPQNRDGGTPAEDGPACWYETADFRNVAVQATWTDAGAVMAGIGGYLARAEDAAGGLVKLQDGTELAGDWDEVRMLGCCTFMAMQGDSMVEVDFGGSAMEETDAATLANAALARLALPLAMDGNAGVGAARTRQASRPRQTDPCGLWSATDIEEVLQGVLREPPRASDGSCTWVYETDAGRERIFVSTVVWRNGYRTWRNDNSRFAGFSANIARDNGGHGPRAGSAVDGPWDAAEDSGMQFNAVKSDVQIALRHAGIGLEQRRALLARAYARMTRGSGETP